MTSTAAGSAFSAPAGSAVLAAVRENRTAARAVDVECAELVVAWVEDAIIDPDNLDAAAGVFDPDKHPGLPDPDEHPGLPGMEQPMRLAGDGAPLVSDLGFTRLATALGRSNEAALGYVGAVVELAYRLPQLWGRVRAGQVSIHRARAVTRMTKKLPFEAAAWVDAQVAWTIGTCSTVQIERTVAAAMQSFDPEQAAKDEEAALEGRRFDIRLDEAGTTATPGAGSVVRVEGGLDLADALDLDATIADHARALAGLLPGTSEDVRRSIAVGDIARGHSPLPLPNTNTSGSGSGSGESAGEDAGSAGAMDGAGDGARDTTTTAAAGAGAGGPSAGSGATGRTVMLYLHLGADALDQNTEPGTDSGESGADSVFGSGIVGRCENTKSPVSKEQVRSWCHTAGRVLVRPVIDLNTHYSASTYEAGPRLREQVTLRDNSCRFPFCNRTARAGDQDHIVPHDQGGPTNSANLASLCRRHHRSKTHAGWSYSMITPGVYLWVDPDRIQYLVTPSGTYLLPRPDAGPGESPPQVVARVRERAVTAMKTTAAAIPPPRFRTSPRPPPGVEQPPRGEQPPPVEQPPRSGVESSSRPEPPGGDDPPPF